MPTTISISKEEFGAIFMMFLLCSALAVPVCLVMRWWYRRAVLRAMRRSFRPADAAASAAARQAPPPGALPPPPELRVEVIHAGRPAGMGAEARALFGRAVRARRSLALVYLLAGGAHTLASLLLYNVVLPRGPEEDEALRLMVSLALLWPAVPVAAAVGVPSRLLQLLGPALYILLVYLLLTLLLPPAFIPADMKAQVADMETGPLVPVLAPLGLSARALVGLGLFLMFMMMWPVLMVVPTLVFVAFQYFRAVGIVVGSALFLVLVAFAAALMLGKAGLGPQAFVALELVAFAAVAAASWLLVRLLARRYAAKKMSDQSAVIDSYWLALSVCEFILMSHFYGAAHGSLFLLPFAVYKLALAAGLRRARGGAAGAPDIRLLLLRVFGSKRHTERLLEELGRFWRYVGSIQLIAGADLATANLEIHEFLDFVSRRLNDRFVKDSADLRARLGAMDLRPDPDGRYRVNEFFCYDDTWRETLVELVRRCDAVLMDLRGFTCENEGCVYELRQLLSLVPAHRLVLTTDGRTDFDFLYATLRAAWLGMDDDSPNRGAAAPVLRVLYAPRQTSRAVRRLLSVLFEAAQAAPRPAPARAELA